MWIFRLSRLLCVIVYLLCSLLASCLRSFLIHYTTSSILPCSPLLFRFSSIDKVYYLIHFVKFVFSLFFVIEVHTGSKKICFLCTISRTTVSSSNNCVISMASILLFITIMAALFSCSCSVYCFLFFHSCWFVLILVWFLN
jgi:hypothetical protein